MQLNNSPRDVVRKLLDSPWLPLLFISKAIEETVYWQFVDGTAEPVVAMSLLGIVSLLAWVFIDDVADEASNITE
jgi:hypothetical protein